MPAHLATAAPVNRLRRAGRAVLAAIAAFATAIVISLAAAGGTFAFFSNSTPVGAGTLQAGVTGLTIQGVQNYTITGLDTTKLLPGTTVITAAPLTVRNTGKTPLAISQGAMTFSTSTTLSNSSYLIASVRRVTTPGCAVGAGTALSTSVTLAPNATMTVCVSVQLAPTAPATVAGQTATFSIPLDAVQVRP